MSCNGNNHVDCDCGWGGSYYGHRGREKEICLEWQNSSSFGSTYSEIPQIKCTCKSYVNPNALCPVCNKPVFFYQSPEGGRVFFDELGPPWPKHPCTDNGRDPKKHISHSSVLITSYKWQKDRWEPFFIWSVTEGDQVYEVRGRLNSGKFKLLLIKGEYSLFLTLQGDTIAYLRKLEGNSGEYEISYVTSSGIHNTVKAKMG